MPEKFRMRDSNPQGIHSNSMMGSQQVKEICQMNEAGRTLLKTAMERLGLSARAYDRILKVSRTIADLRRQRSHYDRASSRSHSISQPR